MSKAVVVKINKQLVGIKVIQSSNAVITTTRVEMIVAPNTNVVRSGVLIRFATNLGRGLGGVSIGKNLNWNSGLPISNYWSSWDTPDGVYQSNNDYSCEQDCKSTTYELNGCWRVYKYKC
jgi:hypothetical protein